MNTLVLVRHLPVATPHRGLWTGGGSDPEADPGARRAAWAPMAALQASWPPGVVLCSPLRRAQQTAVVLDLPLLTDVRLVERDFGPWEGRPVDDVMGDVPPEATAGTEAWLAYDPGGEPFADVVTRVDALWRELAGEAGCVWCVAHGGPLAILRARALGIPVAESFGDPLPHGGWAVVDVDAAAEVGRGRLVP